MTPQFHATYQRDINRWELKHGSKKYNIKREDYGIYIFKPSDYRED